MNFKNKKIYDWEEFKYYILWELDRYDIPLSGVAEIKGEKLYFNCIFNDFMQDTVYELYTLDNWEEEEERHKDFCKYVGNHCNWKDGKRNSDFSMIGKDSDKFYQKYPRLKRDFKEENLVGYVILKYNFYED